MVKNLRSLTDMDHFLAALGSKVKKYEKIYEECDESEKICKPVDFIEPMVKIAEDFCEALKFVANLAQFEEDGSNFKNFKREECPESVLKFRLVVHHITDALIVSSSFYERAMKSYNLDAENQTSKNGEISYPSHRPEKSTRKSAAERQIAPKNPTVPRHVEKIVSKVAYNLDSQDTTVFDESFAEENDKNPPSLRRPDSSALASENRGVVCGAIPKLETIPNQETIQKFHSTSSACQNDEDEDSPNENILPCQVVLTDLFDEHNAECEKNACKSCSGAQNAQKRGKGGSSEDEASSDEELVNQLKQADQLLRNLKRSANKQKKARKNEEKVRNMTKSAKIRNSNDGSCEGDFDGVQNKSENVELDIEHETTAENFRFTANLPLDEISAQVDISSLKAVSDKILAGLCQDGDNSDFSAHPSDEEVDSSTFASGKISKMATTRQMKKKLMDETDVHSINSGEGAAEDTASSMASNENSTENSKLNKNIDNLLKIKLNFKMDGTENFKRKILANGEKIGRPMKKGSAVTVMPSSGDENGHASAKATPSPTSGDSDADDCDDFKPRRKRSTTAARRSDADDDVITKKRTAARRGGGIDQRPRQALSDGDDDVVVVQDDDDGSVSDSSVDIKKSTAAKRGSKRRAVSSNSSSSDDSNDSKRNVRRRGSKKAAVGARRGRKPRRRVAVSTEEEDGEEEENSADVSKAGRRDIRKIQKPSAQQTDAYEEEKERRKRILEKQKFYNEITSSQQASTSKVAPDQCTSLILDQNTETKKVMVQVHPEICKNLKPHQVDGVRFMYQCAVESVDKAESSGTGCILAHCMGLGKTFQVVTLLHTLLSHDQLKTKTALVLAPLNVVLNWEHEFNHWLEHEELFLNVWQLASVKNYEDRAKIVDTWQKNGGVLILGYNLFLSLVDASDRTKKKIKKEKWRRSFLRGFLDPGPDVVICDEGHLLKNEKTGISKAVNKIRTLRRICLTGTPLQNNLKEYYTMVQFVKPNLLGSRQEFANRFENPIKNGQYQDSTPSDVRLMKKRAHILHEMLSGCVQRQNYTALSKALPPKYEYVLSISLSDDQINLYKKYLDEVVIHCDAESLRARRSLFADYQNLQRIWTHPYALLLHTEKMETKERLLEEKEFVVGDEPESESSAYSVYEEEEADGPTAIKSRKDGNLKKGITTKKSTDESEGSIDVLVDEVIKPWKSRTRDGNSKTVTELVDESFGVMPKLPSENQDWYGNAVTEQCKTNLEISGKIFLLFEIIRKCEEIGDKLLVFSQSLVALDIIENFLEFYQKSGWTAGPDSLSSLHGWKWSKDKDYFRLDGSTPAERRKALSKIFNDPMSLRPRLFLISTRAGSLGMNLFGANRVVIFDTNWNPTHDTQSMFRVYRFGQTKPVYVYRFIAHGTMEAKIYERGVTKQSLACRVVDEQQIDRHFLGRDLEALYEFTPRSTGNEKLNTLSVPKDRLLADLLFEQKKWVVTYHEHDTLLANMEEEQLSKEERELAWAEYENERKNPYRAAPAQIPSDKYQVYISAMPLLKVYVDEGENLIVMSGEKVDHTMESIVRNWINTDQDIIRNPSLVVAKAQRLVASLRDMLMAKQAQIAQMNHQNALQAQAQFYQPPSVPQ